MNIFTHTSTAPSATGGSGQTAKNSPKKKGCKVRKWRKPKGMPKRPLSAYNLFFAEERKTILEKRTTKKVGFANLARTVAANWKLLTVTEKQPFALKAGKEQTRYKLELEEWQRRGLDPRNKKVNSKTAAAKKVDQVGKKTVKDAILFVSDSQMIYDLAESTFGDTFEQETSEASENIEPYPVNMISCCEKTFEETMFSKEKHCGSKLTQVEYNELSSRLYQKLSRELDDDEARFFKTTFARSA